MESIKGKWALVTGASRGIGALVADKLADYGCNLVLHSRSVTHLDKVAEKVYLIVRRNVLRASEAMQKKVMERENIEILWETQTVGLFGDGGVEGAHLIKGKGTDHEELLDIAIDGFFLAIGHHPNTEVFLPRTDADGTQHPGVEVDGQGYIKVQHPTTATNIPGVFAAGDVADPLYRQAISAAGSGCHAAMDAERYLSK